MSRGTIKLKGMMCYFFYRRRNDEEDYPINTRSG